MALTGRGRSFRESFGEVFTQYPLQLAKLSDDDVRDLMQRCQGHYTVIQSCLDKHFKAESIDREQVVVEPSFYAERYGLQGRLDVFQPPKPDRDTAIIELKSGKIFRPNEHKVNQEHYVQTLLYDLLIKAVFSDKVRAKKRPLYVTRQPPKHSNLKP
jgi:DNA replication ATP-dependent helicase Dna2